MRRTTANPPIKGHALLSEGKGRVEYEHTADGMQFTGNVLGGCECGAQPPGWPNVSAREAQRWHREHKAQIRAAMEPARGGTGGAGGGGVRGGTGGAGS